MGYHLQYSKLYPTLNFGYFEAYFEFGLLLITVSGVRARAE